MDPANLRPHARLPPDTTTLAKVAEVKSRKADGFDDELPAVRVCAIVG